MLKFKKVLSALLAVSMLGAGASQSAFADGDAITPSYTDTTAFADYEDGWTMKYNGNFDQTNRFGCVTDEQVKSGEHAFLIRNNKKSNSLIELRQDVSLPTDKEMTVSFAAYGTWNGSSAFSDDKTATFDYEAITFNKIRVYKNGGGFDEIPIHYNYEGNLSAKGSKRENCGFQNQ